MEKASIAVIGNSTWGTTLAIINARMGKAVTLITRTAEEASQIVSAGENTRFLPGKKIPKNLNVTNQLGTVIPQAKIVLIAVPSASFRKNINFIQCQPSLKSYEQKLGS